MFSSNGRASSRLVDGRGTDAGSGGRVPHRRSWRGVSMRLRLLAGLGLAVAFLATLATLAALPAPPLQAQTTTEVEVPHNWSLKPDGLGGGDQFRLLFLSSEDTDATSTDHRGLQHLHPGPRRGRPHRHPGLQRGFPGGGLHR